MWHCAASRSWISSSVALRTEGSFEDIYKGEITKVSSRPTRNHHIESIGKIQQSMVVESNSVQIRVIMNTYRLKLELSVGVLVVRDFVDGGNGVDGEFTVTAKFLPRLQRLPNGAISHTRGPAVDEACDIYYSWRWQKLTCTPPEDG